MLNSEKFLNAFVSIERHLRQYSSVDKFVSFYQLVENAIKSSAEVRNLANDLKEYSDLRNAIVHDRSDGYVIAEPNDRAVRDIERIASLLIKPPVVIPLFQAQVTFLSTSDSIGVAVKKNVGKFIFADSNSQSE